jgi:hypothetical protein
VSPSVVLGLGSNFALELYSRTTQKETSLMSTLGAFFPLLSCPSTLRKKIIFWEEIKRLYKKERNKEKKVND